MEVLFLKRFMKSWLRVITIIAVYEITRTVGDIVIGYLSYDTRLPKDHIEPNSDTKEF